MAKDLNQHLNKDTWLPNEMDETGAHYTEWSKPER